MLENIDLSLKVTSEEYKKNMEILKNKLGDSQREAWKAGIPIILVFEGWHGSGLAEDINRVILSLDPRGYDFHTMIRPCYEELLKPFLVRFWIRTPVKGKISIFDRSWYSRAIIECFGREKSEEKMRKCLKQVNDFERQLIDDGTLMLKFFLHISEKEHKERFRNMKKNGIPLILDEYEKEGGQNLDFIHSYKENLPYIEEMLEDTDTPYAPWTVVEANDRNFATLKIMVTIINAIQATIAQQTNTSGVQYFNGFNTVVQSLPEPKNSVLEKVDLSKNISEEEYKSLKKFYQEKLEHLHYELFRKKRPFVIVFEGWDAAGKGGNIHRFVEELNPRLYRVIPVGSPNDIEKAHHYLWRFCTAVPKAGHIAIFDRSWYGRVLVERVEKLSSEDEWKRAYREINEFEEILAQSGTIVLKFWLQIDKETQLNRFESRQNDPEKTWKITSDDWRNRSKWDDYEIAVEEMLKKTNTKSAEWVIVESNDKLYSRIKVLKTAVELLEKELESEGKILS
ncbi:MAG: polyphosphate:AMP phosphotransferase [Methanosarcina sp.]